MHTIKEEGMVMVMELVEVIEVELKAGAREMVELQEEAEVEEE